MFSLLETNMIGADLKENIANEINRQSRKILVPRCDNVRSAKAVRGVLCRTHMKVAHHALYTGISN